MPRKVPRWGRFGSRSDSDENQKAVILNTFNSRDGEKNARPFGFHLAQILRTTAPLLRTKASDQAKSDGQDN